GTECKAPGLLALFVFGLAVVVPAMLRAAEVRALLADRLRFATALGAVRALLQPGAGVGEELALRRRLLAVRSGQGDAIFLAMRAAIAAAALESQRVALREQLILLLVQDRRFADAVDEFEAGPLPIETRPVVGAAMVRALCETGRLEEAIALLRTLEQGSALRDTSALAQVNQARLVLLAFAGQVRAVADLLGDGFLVGLPEATRAFWVGTAAMYAGEPARAREAFERARALASGPMAPRLRALCEARLAQLAEPRSPPALDPAFVETTVARARQTLGF